MHSLPELIAEHGLNRLHIVVQGIGWGTPAVSSQPGALDIAW
jgi:hypothetical protein